MSNTFEIVSMGEILETCTTATGVYQWTNTLNDKAYVGIAAGSKGLRGRISKELASAIGPEAGTPLLTAAFKKYGVRSFKASCLLVLDETDPKVWESLERAYIKMTNCMSPKGYNLTEGGSGTLGHSSLSSAALNRGKPNPAVAEALAKRYELVSPEGTKHYITNLAAFTRAQGLPPNTLHQLFNGVPTYKGWRAARTVPDAYYKSLSNTAYFVSPDGVLTKVTNINRFAKANGLQQGAVNNVWLGKPHYLQTKGWRKAFPEEIASFDAKLHKTWEFDKWL